MEQQGQEREQSGASQETPPSVTIKDRLTYFVGVGAPVTGALAVIGMGEASLFLGGLAALGVAYFSPEIRATVVRHMPASIKNRAKRPAGRDLSWWFKGDDGVPPETADDKGIDASRAIDPDVQSLDDKEATALYDRWNSEPVQPAYAPLPHPEQPVRASHSDEPRPEQTRRPLVPLFPITPEQWTLKLGYCPAFPQRPRFDPPINLLLGRGGLLAGSQGAGKSNIIGLTAQSAGGCGMPLVIIDYKGEFYPIRDVVPNGILAGHPSFADEAGPGFYPLTVENAAAFAQLVMEGAFQAIIDIPSYGADCDEMAQVVAALLHGFMDWARGLRRQGKKPWPCLVITDEAHHFLPERQKLSGFAMRRPAESFGVLASAYSRMANSGRSFGYTLVLATQRLPNIAKWAIGNLHVKVILAHVEKNDLDACEEETGGQISRENIKSLEPGMGIVVGLTKEPTIVRFDRQKAIHVSDTPGVERIAEVFTHTPIREQHAQMPDSWGHRPMPRPQTYERPLNAAQVHATVAMREMPPMPTRVQPAKRYENEIKVWHEIEAQQCANVRDFARALNIGPSKAYTLLDEMDRLGLIQWERRKKGRM